MSKYNAIVDGQQITIEHTLEKICRDFTEDQEKKALRIMKEIAQETAKELKQVSPKSKRSGRHYKSGWAVKAAPKTAMGKSGGFIVYNKLKPGLTFLLEHGHTTNKGTGRGQRIHIGPVEKRKTEELLQRLESEL